MLHSRSSACRGWRIGVIVVITLLIASPPSDARGRVRIWLPRPIITKVMDNHSRSRTVKNVRGEKKESRSVVSDRRISELKRGPSSGATEGTAPYPTGQANDFYGPMGPRIHKVPGRSLAYSYASQGYFNRAAVCVAHGDGTMQDISSGKAAYAKSGRLKLTRFGERLTKGVRYVPRKIVTCPECDGTGRGYYTGSCWKCGGSGSVKQSQGWNAILGLD
jgi:hypothetical protein